MHVYYKYKYTLTKQCLKNSLNDNVPFCLYFPQAEI